MKRLKIQINNPLLLTKNYDYELPKKLIATTPAVPKDSAKLLVYNRETKTTTHTIFSNILNYIPQNTHIFFNDTKVIKARIFGKKESGGKIELLLNSPFENGFLVYIKGRVKQNGKLFFDNSLEAKVIKLNEDGTREVEFYQNSKILNFDEVVKLFDKIGHIPLPPYINREDNKSDESDYQTLFAKNYGAVAAPTASLHFTPKLLNELKNRFETSYLTLHVGAGTFKPVESEIITNHPMHSELFNISNNSRKIIDTDKKILAVGTTVTRTIEYYHKTKEISGEANIFIHPESLPKRVNYLLTNFHLPKSTLIMLVASFIGVDKTLGLYQEAIKEEYKFYSYGDAMLVI